MKEERDTEGHERRGRRERGSVRREKLTSHHKHHFINISSRCLPLLLHFLLCDSYPNIFFYNLSSSFYRLFFSHFLVIPIFLLFFLSFLFPCSSYCVFIFSSTFFLFLPLYNLIFFSWLFTSTFSCFYYLSSNISMYIFLFYPLSSSFSYFPSSVSFSLSSPFLSLPFTSLDGAVGSA